jgi:hypothetical protein
MLKAGVEASIITDSPTGGASQLHSLAPIRRRTAWPMNSA